MPRQRRCWRWAEAMARLHRGGARPPRPVPRRNWPCAPATCRWPITSCRRWWTRRRCCSNAGARSSAWRRRRARYGELRQLARDLGTDENASISPSDACPDDNVLTPDGLMIVDFEGAQWRHIAWDLAYLTVPWPTCWCSWRMPADVSERALERYRHAVEDVLPYVRTAQFRSDLAAAALGWAMVTVAHLLHDATGDDPPPHNPDKLTPRRRALIEHRLDRARRAGEDSALARLAGRLRGVLVERWGELPLGYAPAFDYARPLGSTACSAGMVWRRSRPAGATAWSPSESSTACTAATPRSSAGPWHGPASWTCRACCVTFVPHPSEVVRPGSHPPVLTSIPRRAELVGRLGIDVFCALPFTPGLLEAAGRRVRAPGPRRDAARRGCRGRRELPVRAQGRRRRQPCCNGSGAPSASPPRASSCYAPGGTVALGDLRALLRAGR